MKTIEEIAAAFEYWWQHGGAELYAEFISGRSATRAAIDLARAAYVQGVTDSGKVEPTPIPGVILSETESALETKIENVSDSFTDSEIPTRDDSAAPPVSESVERSGRVLCGACQNCGLENMTESETADVKCAGCEYVGPLAGIFSRPAPK